MNELICSLCERVFDTQDRVPRLFPNCGHTFCSLCVESLISDSDTLPVCPEDDIECTNYNPDKGINSFPVNVTLQRLLNNRKDRHHHGKGVEKHERGTRISDFSGIQFCSEHQKVADLVCRTDRNVICSDCALFGEHRSHDYVRSDDFKTVIKEKAMNLGIELDKLRTKSFASKNDRRIDELNAKVIAKRDEILTTISEKFALVEEELRKKETELKDKLNKRIEKFSEALEYISESAKGLREKEEMVKNKLLRTNNLLKSSSIDYRFLLDSFYDKYDLHAILKEVSHDFDQLEKHSKEIIDQELDKIQVTGDILHLLEGIWNSLCISIEDGKKSISGQVSKGQLLLSNVGDTSNQIEQQIEEPVNKDVLCPEPISTSDLTKNIEEPKTSLDNCVAVQTGPDSLSISQICIKANTIDLNQDGLKTDRIKRNSKAQNIFSDKKAEKEIAERSFKSNTLINNSSSNSKGKTLMTRQSVANKISSNNQILTYSPNKFEKDPADGRTESHLSNERYDRILEENEQDFANQMYDEEEEQDIDNFEPSDIDINKSMAGNETVNKPQLDIDHSKSLLDDDFDDEDDHSLMDADSELSQDQNMSISANHNVSKNQSFTRNRGQSPMLNSYQGLSHQMLARPANSLYTPGHYYANSGSNTTMGKINQPQSDSKRPNESLIKNNLNKPYEKQQNFKGTEKILDQGRLSNNNSLTQNNNPSPSYTQSMLAQNRASMLQNTRGMGSNGMMGSTNEISNPYYQFQSQVFMPNSMLATPNQPNINKTIPINTIGFQDIYSGASMNYINNNGKVYPQMNQMNQYMQMQNTQAQSFYGNSPNYQMNNSNPNNPRLKLNSLKDDEMNTPAEFEREKSPLTNQKFTKKTQNISGKAIGADNDTEANYARQNINDSKLIQILSDISKNKRLKVLNLSYNFITDLGAEQILKKLASHPTLEKIYLTGNFIEEGIFQKLEDSAKTFKKINYFNFQENKGFKNMAKVKKHVSNLKRFGVKIDV